jgi:hypothetical protein
VLGRLWRFCFSFVGLHAGAVVVGVSGPRRERLAESNDGTRKVCTWLSSFDILLDKLAIKGSIQHLLAALMRADAISRIGIRGYFTETGAEMPPADSQLFSCMSKLPNQISFLADQHTPTK